MSTLKKLEAEKIVSFKLREDKYAVWVDSFEWAYPLDRSELSVLIDELTELRDGMVIEQI